MVRYSLVCLRKERLFGWLGKGSPCRIDGGGCGCGCGRLVLDLYSWSSGSTSFFELMDKGALMDDHSVCFTYLPLRHKKPVTILIM